MKPSSILLLSVICYSCSQKVEQPATDKLVENYVKNKMKGPASFQLIKIELKDTVMMNKWLCDQYTNDTMLISETIADNSMDALAKKFPSAGKAENEYVKQGIDELISVYRETAIKDSLELSKHNPDRILFISYRVRYRAKSSAGTLDTGNSLVNYYPADSTFQVDKFIK
jgi:hypothetical protein